MNALIEYSSHGEHLHLLHVRTLCYLSACCTTIHGSPILINTIVYIHGLYQLAWDVETEAMMREQQDLEDSRDFNMLFHNRMDRYSSQQEAARWQEHMREAALELEAEETWDMLWSEPDSW